MPVLSLGTMRFASAEVACSVVEKAIAQGITHLETAPAYGASERYLGEAIAQIPGSRDDLILTTKLTPTLSAAEVNGAIAQSLAHLNTDYIDCLAIHGINTPEHLDWATAEMLEPLLEAKAAGRIRHIGFSTHGPLDLILRAIYTGSFDFVNLHYNYFFSGTRARSPWLISRIWAFLLFRQPTKPDCFTRPLTYSKHFVLLTILCC